MKTVCLLYILQLYLNCSKWVNGNLLFNKPSSDSQGNDMDPSCLLSTNAALPYWQVDLQGYYQIDNVKIITCWGLWGWKTQSAMIEVFFSNPETCIGCEGFLYGITPPDTEEDQILNFSSEIPYGVRYLRVTATLIAELGLRDVEAIGTPFRKSRDLSFSGENNKRVTSAVNATSVSSAGECGVKCYDVDFCLAFSFIPGQTENCILSDCASTDDVIGWRTMTMNLTEAASSSCAPER